MKRREFITLLGGAAAAWPIAARAQQSAMPVIGFLDLGPPRPKADYVVAFKSGLADAGFIEGKNVTIEYRWGNHRPALLPMLAGGLVHHQVAVIVTADALTPVRVAKAATSTIPIVFAYSGDPVQDGLVASLNRPGGNITGITDFAGELAGKRLDLLHKLVPQATTVGYLSQDATVFHYEQQKSLTLAAARALGLQLTVVECRSDRDFEAAFATLVQRRAEALTVGPFVFGNLSKAVALAARHKIPTMYPSRSLTSEGGLMSYDTDFADSFKRVVAGYVAQILKGAQPADLPVQQPTKFNFVINLKTARALELTVPPTLLALADEVIE
jgi:putative ABC transport system substrate-binding protein